MHYKGIKNNNYTNRIIKCLVIAGDFVVLWILLYFVVDTIPSSKDWDVDKNRMFWIVGTLSLLIAEFRFPTVIHLRVVGAADILRRSTLLVLTQTLLAYLILRAIHFMARLGWQLFFMGIAMWVLVIFARFIVRWLLKQFRRLGYNTRNITMVGADEELDRLYMKITSNPTYGYKLCNRYVSADDFASRMDHPEALNLGDELYLCVPRKEQELIKRTASLCYHQMVKFFYVPTAEEKLNLQSVYIDDIEVMATYTSPLEEPLNRLVKRLSDILLSTLFLLPTALLLPFIALIIKRQSPGPVFFRQRRTGLDGREFYCYKFRSMHVNVDADRLQATKDDPRKFPFGNFIRKTNIDELPQFWNVLVGEMSIVGPRPHMLAHTEQYDKLIDKYMVRHFVKPGVTGWAQVTGFRGETRELWQMEGRVERDIWYIQNWSLWLDLRIIWLTVKTIFKRDDKAY